MDEIVKRCSKFSGYNLQWRVRNGEYGKVLIIEDPAKPDSTLVVSATSYGLHEVYGRLRHWAITNEEQEVMRKALTSNV